MNKPLMEVVLPRLARPLYHQLERFQSGKLDESQFTENFEAILRRHHRWLSRRGVSAAKAAVAIHAAVLVLSLPGMRAEAEEEGVPLEVVEHRALKEAALDIASCYGLPYRKVAHRLAVRVARYGD
ncbi:MAG: hypothetical protein U0793_16490 [Gemmataceae bacterium]